MFGITVNRIVDEE